MFSRKWIAVPVIFVAALSAASGEVASLDPCAAHAGAQPSNLDYLALASMAYSQRPLAMAAYRPQRQESAVPAESLAQ
jgi:hypothetical protein